EAHLQTVGGAWGAAAVQLAADVELDAELLASRAAHGVLPALARAYAAGGEPPGIRQVGIIRRAQHGEDRRRVIGPPDDERDGPMGFLFHSVPRAGCDRCGVPRRAGRTFALL